MSSDSTKQKHRRGHDDAYRSKGDRIEFFARPKGVKAQYQKALARRGATMKQDLEDHIHRTIDKAKK